VSVTPITFPDLSGVAGTAGANLIGAGSGVGAATGVSPTDATSAVGSTSGVDFGNLLLDGIDRLQGMQNKSDGLAVQAATGDESAIHDYTIAATEASTATQLAVTLRNQAIGAFNQIMQMQV
jgi:flagellar hook-basal body complex protein FliE